VLQCLPVPAEGGGGGLRPQSLLGCLPNLSVSSLAHVGAAGENLNKEGRITAEAPWPPGCNPHPAAIATSVCSTLRCPLRRLHHSHGRPLRLSSTTHLSTNYHPVPPIFTYGGRGFFIDTMDFATTEEKMGEGLPIPHVHLGCHLRCLLHPDHARHRW
jgi:hypothetical protein